ncbi:MAG TPA: S8 family serine peptidase [Solirubrobacteraceae bacterium]|nr:S8 family serine peptidase [Solirubrobacteraceae bacterium]
MTKLIGVAVTVAACAVLAAPAGARSVPYTVRPMVLPPASATPRAAGVQPRAWLVGARPGRRTAALARRFGARALRLDGAYRIGSARARAFASALRSTHALVYAEPDTTLRRRSVLDANPVAWARGALVPPTLAPPIPSRSIGVIDDFVDTTLPDLAAQTRIVNGPATVLGPHGTGVASAASAAFNGAGVTGVFPGVPILNYGLPPSITCSAAANGIQAMLDQKASIINLSFGSANECFTLFRAVEGAFGAGALVVAAGGNEFLQGNAPSYPASWPHVLSVAAIDQTLRPAFFSNANAAIDVSAPGEGVPVDVPLAFDADGTPDGLTLADGTSFAAPMVAGAAAWIWSARTDLTNGQLADILRESAQDVADPGYDPQTGFGLVNVPRALGWKKRPSDPLEPNDEITFIDGSSFQEPDPYVWRGPPRRPLLASADEIEDPVDVYRIRVPARRRVRIEARTLFGDADLFVFRGSARTLGGRPLARSTRDGRATDRVTIANPSGSSRRFYVAIRPVGRSTLNSVYTLRFRRL